MVFYQNSSSILSGIFTLLMNRVGDAFFLISISLSFLYYSEVSWFYSNLSVSVFSIFLCITFMTKSALYPFSSWLPMAMSAPTPISALVHSSTLVTAGLFLMMRFHYIFYYNVLLMQLMVFIGLFTSFYAGLNAMFESDMKKIIALSTLSHLGFISFSFASGMLSLSFFHLLVHALFKSLLFMSMGDIIVGMSHSQDIRYLSSGAVFTPFSYTIMAVSLVNLLGMPNLSGFFSKDFVLELFSFSSASYFLVLLVYMNVFLTYYYTYTFFSFSFKGVSLVSFNIMNHPKVFQSILMTLLALVSIVFGKIFLSSFLSFAAHVCIPSDIKVLPFMLNMLFMVFLFIFMAFPKFKLLGPVSFFF